MDLLAACRVFVSISESGGFTLGAAAVSVPQSVASRRVAALEAHLGDQLFDRRSRGARLTAFGQEMLPPAKRLVWLAESIEHEARLVRSRPIRLAVPDTCTTGDLARLAAAAGRLDMSLDLRPAAPAERAEMVRSRDVRAGLLAVPPDEATWRVELGLAGVAQREAGSIFVETLKLGRGDHSTARARIWIQPEDDVPHVRDLMMRARDATGLAPTQVVVGRSLTAAVAGVLGSADLLLCSELQADDLDLYWRPVGGVQVARGFDVVADAPQDADRLTTRLSAEIAKALGASRRGVGHVG